ncbi:MAG: glycyl-radical enzyme activating protein [Cytophagales bacterium]|nr:glycyl-radical enzyme activating protein [Cytophagales bacterium]
MSSVTIFDIKRFAIHDGPGIRTTVFLKGCPMDCWWCHNPESRKSEPEKVTYNRMLGDLKLETKQVYGKKMDTDTLMEEILKDKLFFEESGGGVTFSGGEPLYQIEGLSELLNRCKKQGLHTTIDTCGYAPWASLEMVLPFTDLILYDLKLMDSRSHKKFTGVKNDLIIHNLKKLMAQNARVELRIPVVPGINNSAEELTRFKAFLQENSMIPHKLHLLPYHSIADNKYEKLRAKNRMKDIGQKEGLTVHDFKCALATIGIDVETGG